MKNKSYKGIKKYMKVLILPLSILMLALSVFILAQINRTAYWSTYVNKDFGFKFQYPNDHEIVDQTKISSSLDKNILYRILVNPKVFDVKNPDRMWISVIKETSYQYIKEHKLNEKDLYIAGTFIRTIINDKKFKLGNKDAIKITKASYSGISEETLKHYFDRTEIIVPFENKTLIIATSELKNDNQPLSHIFDKIIATFKFTN